MSNWAVQPVVKTASTARTPAGATSALWANGEEVPEDFANGYAFAIESASTTVLSVLQSRCAKRVGPVRAAGACAYSSVGAKAAPAAAASG